MAGVKLAGLLLLLSIVSVAQSDSSAREPRLNQVFGELHADAKSPGFAVLVRDHGKTIFKRAVGVTDLRTKNPLTPTTNFRLASCTKQFTAMSIMLLVHDGKLRYDQTLTDVFPDFPAYGKNITIRNLLNHSGGLPDYEDLMELPANQGRWSEQKQISDAEVLALLKKESRGKFTPGTQWSYSNSGYVVLGLVVSKVSGMSFPEFLRARIFAPLKMSHTLAYVKGTNTVPQRAYGNTQRNGKFVETDQSSTSATLGDGGVYSNLVDLAKWDDALTHNTLLSTAEMQPALRPFMLPRQGKSAERLPKWSGDSGDEDPQHGKPVAYGFGWFVDPYVDAAGKSHERMWHYGDTIGF